MPWSFVDTEYHQYDRNPLVSTDVELRFHPIFRIADKGDIAKYQDLVRKKFPMYGQDNIREVNVDQNGNFSINDEIEHRFIDVAQKNSIILSPRSIRLSSADHQCRKDLIEGFSFAFNALQNVFGEVNGTRLGVRYVNLIDKERIYRDLGGGLADWGELINSDFLKMPNNIATIEDTDFTMTMKSTLPEKDGMLTLRYGFGKASPDAEHRVFRFDIDRYCEVKNLNNQEFIGSCLGNFTQDIYSLFNAVLGEKLKVWMQQEVQGA
ncbi:TIGR04255 family protein [Spongiibacter sp. KMU-158]|uniref:TIGR04255 family protein n=1 Tax=Spongiibacter pelagi TaxID=2760804 RepID=A0A927C2R0_9GAMM|nr:TIGR04255 family protein [Spongiibacter pelagi]MBD2860219.1 TIGR04255 family protein [Spongiibacter pelagi]